MANFFRLLLVIISVLFVVDQSIGTIEPDSVSVTDNGTYVPRYSWYKSLWLWLRDNVFSRFFLFFILIFLLFLLFDWLRDKKINNYGKLS